MRPIEDTDEIPDVSAEEKTRELRDEVYRSLEEAARTVGTREGTAAPVAILTIVQGTVYMKALGADEEIYAMSIFFSKQVRIKQLRQELALLEAE